VFGASTAIGLHATGAIPSALAADATVEITDSGYDPTTVTITAGSVVTWANTGTSVHTVTSDTGLFDSGDLAGGADFANLFDTAGTFAYHDTADPTHKGSVIVTAAPPTATGAGTPEPTPPPGTLPPGFGSPSPEPATAAPSPSAPGSGPGDSGSSGPATSILLFVVAAVAIALGIFFARRRRPPSA
jgi:plastocyanin